MTTPLIDVTFFAFLTAVCTGLGALPFLFWKKISKTGIAKANAVAAGLMISASFGLIYQGVHLSPEIIESSGLLFSDTLFGVSGTTWGVIAGILVGLTFITISDKVLSRYDLHVYDLSHADAKKVLLIIGIMTLHSFTEGVAIGVSFGPGETFGLFIALALAVHNIPEGLAISTVMVPRGVPWRKAGLWSIFSSIPQPLMALPAFLFVNYFAPFLPFGLGFAAGAMLWMSVSELLPDALKNAPHSTVATIITIAVACMILFEQIVA